MEYENIEPNVFKPEKDGDQVEGKLVKKQDNVGINNSRCYHLQTKDGQIMVWGSTILDSRMDYVDVGNNVRITFKGITKNKKGQDTKLFKVERGREEPVPEDKVEEEVVTS